MLSNVDAHYRWWKAKKGCLFVGAADAEATHLTKPNASAGGRGY